MAKTKTIRVTEEELAALEAVRAGKVEAPKVQAKAEGTGVTDAQQALANAFVDALERTKGPVKQMPGMRKKKTPWSPAEGEPQLKMKRVFYHHGLPLSWNINNETIGLLNQLKPGAYCDNFVRVTLRKDRGIDITYPVRTNSQRLKLVNEYGIRSFDELLRRCIDEKANPTKYRRPEDADLFDLE